MRADVGELSYSGSDLITLCSSGRSQTANFAASMVVGFISSLVFIVACWYGFSRNWSFDLVLSVGAVVWSLIMVGTRYWLWR